MSRIPQHFIDELLARTDIVEVIDARVPLKKKGREYGACCPFHNEKTPSFYVSPAKQFYHCFGCGAHGTAISFLMDYERLEFPDAVRQLAEHAGVEVPVEAGGKNERSNSVLYEVLAEAMAFYQRQLRATPAAIDYLKGRGLSGDIAAAFGIGYAPAGWESLSEALRHHDAQNLLAAGLVIRRDTGSHYDRFRERIMFPHLHGRRLFLPLEVERRKDDRDGGDRDEDHPHD